MNLWLEFLAANRPIILFVQGEVFFVLGLAIVWQSRRHSRLALARSLGWLGAFGLTHAMYEWGNIFIPIQAQYLSQAWIELLLLFQAFLLAFSFAALFQFGAEALSACRPSLRWLQVVPGGLLILWMAAFLWTSQVTRLAPAQFVIHANVWARYLLGIPGAITAALALMAQKPQPIQAGSTIHQTHAFQVAGVALVSYAILTGLLVPPAPFFPANLINSDLVLSRVGLPVEVLRSVVGLVLVISIVRGLEIFRMEADRRIEEMEQAQILTAERERISREIHDGTIQTIYTAGLIAESVRKRLSGDDPMAARLDTVVSALDHAIHDLRQLIVDLERSASNESLADGLRRLADESYLASLLEVEVTVAPSEEGLTLPSGGAAHVLAIAREALSNVARHAQARHAWVVAEQCDGQLQITVADDGIGFGAQEAGGFGLRNMRDRARMLGGSVRVEPRSPSGTQVVLTIPRTDAR
jgi:signal transduction histidine kinase